MRDIAARDLLCYVEGGTDATPKAQMFLDVLAVLTHAAYTLNMVWRAKSRLMLHVLLSGSIVCRLVNYVTMANSQHADGVELNALTDDVRTATILLLGN